MKGERLIMLALAVNSCGVDIGDGKRISAVGAFGLGKGAGASVCYTDNNYMQCLTGAYYHEPDGIKTIIKRDRWYVADYIK